MWCYHTVGITLISACSNTAAELFWGSAAHSGFLELRRVPRNCQRCSQYTRYFYRAVLVRCLSWAAGMVSRSNRDTSFLSQGLSWVLGFRQEGRAPSHFFFCWCTRVSLTSLLPRHFSETKRGRHQFQSELVLRLFSQDWKWKKEMKYACEHVHVSPPTHSLVELGSVCQVE